jgi:hypothetical protein
MLTLSGKAAARKQVAICSLRTTSLIGISACTAGCRKPGTIAKRSFEMLRASLAAAGAGHVLVALQARHPQANVCLWWLTLAVFARWWELSDKVAERDGKRYGLGTSDFMRWP